jgi:hypothetical protein
MAGMRIIDEDDGSALPRSYFFNAGHLLRFQVVIAVSSRCRACFAGRRSHRITDWRDTPVRRATSAACTPFLQ